MAAIKFFLCFTLIFALSWAEELSTKPTLKKLRPVPAHMLKESRATVLDGNLPESDLNELANDLQNIYDTEADPLARAFQFQDKLQAKYPNTYNNVVVNYDAIAFYQQHYLVVAVGGDWVVGFGI